MRKKEFLETYGKPDKIFQRICKFPIIDPKARREGVNKFKRAKVKCLKYDSLSRIYVYDKEYFMGYYCYSEKELLKMIGDDSLEPTYEYLLSYLESKGNKCTTNVSEKFDWKSIRYGYYFLKFDNDGVFKFYTYKDCTLYLNYSNFW